MKLNMNGSDDPSYRYKVQGFEITNAGNGNGRFTILNNIDTISKTINHPEQVLCKYIANILGSSYNEKKKTLTGHYNVMELNKIILDYIKYVVLCPKCNIPETIPSVFGSKKNAEIKLSCSACKNESTIVSNNKDALKAVDIIVKYLNCGNKWEITKGIISVETSSNELDPFMMQENLNIDEI